jgi:transposase
MISTTNYTVNYTTNQLVLPIEIGIQLEENSEVYTYLELMKGIDLKKYFDSPETKGRNRKNRVQILNAILFGFMVDVRSTRKIESACKNDIRFMYLLGEMNSPSHTLINDVMNEIKDKLDYLLLEINQEIMKREDLELEYLYIDGTKIEADANKYTFVWRKSIIKYQSKLYEKITKELPILNEIFKQYGYKRIPKKDKYLGQEIEKTAQRLLGISNHLKIEFVYGKGKRKTPIQRVYDTFKTYAEKLKAYEKDLEIIGSNRNSYSKTDYDATFMHMKDDHMRNAQLKPGYNVQIGVSNEYIMAIEAYQNGSDQLTFEPFLEKYNLLYGKYPKYPVADAGYGGYDNYIYCIEHEMELYQKYNTWKLERSSKHKKNIFHKDNFKIDNDGDYRCPRNKKFHKVYEYQSKYLRHEHIKIKYECEYCERCRLKKKCTKAKTNRTITEIKGFQVIKNKVKENLASELGIKLRTNRSIQVEGAFGIIKEDMKFRRFTRTMFSGIKLELNMIAIGYNLKKYYNKNYR